MKTIKQVFRSTHTKLGNASAVFIAMAVTANVSQAAPFESCPSEAFLTQSKPALLYGVDLSTGSYEEAGDVSTNDKLNAMGFSFHDAFLYAWYYEGQTLARIHSDYSIEPLTLQPSLPMDYFVGDVSILQNAYYMYRSGGDYNGLWRIALDSNDPDYLQPQRVVDGSVLQLKIFDLAFHPSNGYAYSVDSAGILWRIDTAGTAPANLGNVGQGGTFGAVYFDAAGTLYISRNQDGKIFSIDVEQTDPFATLFSYGPSSSNNDGARCALAPVAAPEVATLDFGDAPASYGTRLQEDGARHSVDGTLKLGEIVDAENRAFLAPDESDDVKDDSDDEDGVQFLTDITIGEQALVEVTVTGTGYLSLWVDYDRDGVFSADEQAIADVQLATGTSFQNISVPATAVIGDSWVRVRLSSVAGLNATGPAPDGEVEDYPVSIVLPSTSTQYYPSADGFVTLAFEDLWPSRGDYDMNDFVVYYKTAITQDIAGETPTVKEIRISGEIVAVGAAFHSGFAVSIPGVRTRDVDESAIELLINNQQPTSYDTGVEAPFQPLRGTVSRLDDNALLEITRDVWTTVERGEGCFFHRTDSNCGAGAPVSFDLRVPIAGNVPATAVSAGVFNPFVFATNGYTRNSIFKDEQGNLVAPGDGLEIHLKNHAPSWRADTTLLGRSSDISTASSDPLITYQTAQGLPWAIEIAGRWCHPGEYQDVTVAYPLFATFVASEGSQAGDWFYVSNAASHPEFGKAGYLYRENGLLDPTCAGSN